MTAPHAPNDCASCRHCATQQVQGYDQQGARVTVPARYCEHPKTKVHGGRWSAGLARDALCRGKWWGEKRA